MKIKKFLLIAYIFFPVFCFSQTEKNSETKKQSEATMQKRPLYNVMYANHQRNSFSNTTTSAKGKIVWSVPIEERVNNYLPGNIILWDNDPAVATSDKVMLFDSQGKKLWTLPIFWRSPVVFSENKLFYQSPSHFLDAIDKQGKQVIKSAPFPGAMGGNVEIDLLFPRKDDFIAVIYNNDQRDHQQGEAPRNTEPTLTIVQNRYPTTYGDQLKTVPADSHLRSLYHAEKNILAINTTQVFRMNAEQNKEISKFSAPMQNPNDWCMDNDENYFFTGYNSDKIELVSTDFEGKQRWSWSAVSKEKWLRHPPGIGINDRVYVMTTGRVVVLDSGKLVWEFKFANDSEDYKFITVLADNSLLITQGQELILMSSSGKKNWSLNLKENILHPAVVDEKGNIYVTTILQIIKVN